MWTTGGSVKSILLVEDSRFLRRTNERILTRAGYQVVIAVDGGEALHLARTTAPDLILLDMLLPKIGGAQVLRALQSDPVTAKTPVVVLSSLPQSNERKLKGKGRLPISRNRSLIWRTTRRP